jgi:hypothetical protein
MSATSVNSGHESSTFSAPRQVAYLGRYLDDDENPARAAEWRQLCQKLLVLGLPPPVRAADRPPNHPSVRAGSPQEFALLFVLKPFQPFNLLRFH